MRSTYRILAYIIAAEVVVQASAIAFGLAGLAKYIDDGATVDKALFEDESVSFTGFVGFIIHGINGTMVIPVLALLFLIFSFFAKVPGGSKWAGTIVALVAIQIALGIFSRANCARTAGATDHTIAFFSIAWNIGCFHVRSSCP